MSTPDDGAPAPGDEPGGVAPVPERRPVGERRQRLGDGGVPADDDGAPLTRREMKARGMVFTTELPVIAAPLTELPRPDAADGAAAPTPQRRAVRDRLAESTVGAAEPASERTTTGRRPVVRPPTAARGIRRLDETGTVSAVRPVVATGTTPPPAADPLTDPGPTNVAASWESAVSTPAVALGIEDSVEAPAEAAPLTLPRTELVAPPIRSPRRESLRDQAGRGLPGAGVRPAPPEASPGWSALLDEEAASTGTLLARVATSLAEPTATSTPRVDAGGLAAVAAQAGEPDPAGPAPEAARPAGDAPEPDAVAAEPDAATAEPDAETGEPDTVRSAESGPVVGDERRWWPAAGVVRFALLLALGVAIGLVIVLIANGSLGNVFADGLGAGAPGAPPSVGPTPPSL